MMMIFFLHYLETNDEKRETQHDPEDEKAAAPEVNADPLIGMSNAFFFYLGNRLSNFNNNDAKLTKSNKIYVLFK